MDSETKLIERIAREVPSDIGMVGHTRLLLGIGDDAAIVVPHGRTDLVVTSDAFLEGVHFLDHYPPDSVGYKSLVRATSDIAAMGGTPTLFLLTLALPAGRTGKWLQGFTEGMGRAARLMNMRLAGGDTTISPMVSISVTVLGEVRRNLDLRRSGAKAGDIIYVSGRLGQAALGLELMRRGFANKRRFHPLLESHLYPPIRLQLGAWLAQHRVPSAMMDLSDGLSTDLGRLCAMSETGARLVAGHIPCVVIPQRGAGRLSRKLGPLSLALNGGEDYELLFTVPPRKQRRLQGAPGRSEITAIGHITREKKILLVTKDGLARPLAPHGWNPFRRKS